jgi:fimbrial chaperone protein
VAQSVQAASSILIWPIDPVLEADQQASALWLENRGDTPANLQVRVFAWNQQGFDDKYENQRDVVGSPPVATILPGQKQLIRLTRAKSFPAGEEHAYRIIIDEIPLPLPPAEPGSNKTAAAIRLQMRYSVPLFAYGAGLWSKPDASRPRDPTGAGLPQLSGRTLKVDGKSYIELINRGAVHARLTEASLKSGSQSKPVVEGLFGYVLPGATMRWPAPVAQGDALQVRVNGQTQLQTVPLGQ